MIFSRIASIVCSYRIPKARTGSLRPSSNRFAHAELARLLELGATGVADRRKPDGGSLGGAGGPGDSSSASSGGDEASRGVAPGDFRAPATTGAGARRTGAGVPPPAPDRDGTPHR
jgi:hypothetical protein